LENNVIQAHYTLAPWELWTAIWMWLCRTSALEPDSRSKESIYTLSKSSHLLGVTPYEQKIKVCEKIVDNLAIARAVSIVQDVELS